MTTTTTTDAEIMNKIAGAIRQARREKDWTQSKLAERAGLTVSQVCLFESGIRTPNAKSLVRLLLALGLDPFAGLSRSRDVYQCYWRDRALEAERQLSRCTMK